MCISSKTKSYSNIIQNYFSIHLLILDLRSPNLNAYFFYFNYQTLYCFRYCFCKHFLIKYLV